MTQTDNPLHSGTSPVTYHSSTLTVVWTYLIQFYMYLLQN